MSVLIPTGPTGRYVRHIRPKSQSNLCRFRLRAPCSVPDISELDIIALHGAATWLFHRQVLREEDYLKQRYGDEYANYS